MTLIAPENAHFTVEEYHQIVEVGILNERRVELINGLIVEMIVDIKNRKLIVYRFPEAEDYQQKRKFSATETVSPLAFQDISIPVSDIFAI
ncbi:MAG: hypothetical protein AB4426_26010 [Xenococcaceae cyanobacterium]